MNTTHSLKSYTRPCHLVLRSLVTGHGIWLLVAAFACVIAMPVNAQTIYRYTDRDGAVVLTDKPPKGVKAEPLVTGAPEAKPPSVAEPPPPPPRQGAMTGEEALRQRDRQLEDTLRTVEARDRDKEMERQKRLQEADRLEAEARQPMPSTRENRQRQYELLQEAQKLRQQP